MTRQGLADKLEAWDRDAAAAPDLAATQKLANELADLIEGDNLRMICAALRRTYP
jgi:hypothetical protein